MFELERISSELKTAQKDGKKFTLRTNIPTNGDPNNFYEFKLNQKVTSGLNGTYVIKGFEKNLSEGILEIQTDTYDGKHDNFIIGKESIVMIKKER